MNEEAMDRYLREEKDDYENDLSLDEIKELDLLKDGIRMSALREKVEMLKELEESIGIKSTEQTGRVINLNQVMAIAASLTLFIVAGLWFFNNSNPSTDELYSSYYSKVPGISESMRSTDDEQSIFDLAIGAYNASEYESALAQFESIDNHKALFYQGIIRMELGEYEDAIETLLAYNEIAKSEESFPVRYYLALCYLKIGEVSTSKSYLQGVNESNSEYYQRAQELLDKL